MSQPRLPRRLRRQLPAICVDEHIPPAVTRALRDVFATIEASRDRRFRGRDERRYLNELYRENAIFVTSDEAHVKYVAKNRFQHGELLHIPAPYCHNDKSR